MTIFLAPFQKERSLLWMWCFEILLNERFPMHANTNYSKCVQNTSGHPLTELLWFVNLHKIPSLRGVMAVLCPEYHYTRETFSGWREGSAVCFIMWISNGKLCLRQFHLRVKEVTYQPDNIPPPRVSLGTVHKASLWVLPAGIHLKTAEHNFGIKVELDLKGKWRKCPKPIIILTSKEVIENVDRNPCKGRAN